MQCQDARGVETAGRRSLASTPTRGLGAPRVLPFGYRAYGLAIESAFALPELSPDAAETPDMAVRLHPVDWPGSQPPAGAIIDLSADVQYLAWANVARYAIRAGRTLDVEIAPGSSEALARLPLLGPVMALALYLRGMFVLHASAVAIDGRGAIFVGDRGAGKSTMAAALVARGHPLLADDVVAVDVSGTPCIVPGFPQLKLDSRAAVIGVGEGVEVLPPALPTFHKRQHILPNGLAHAPVSPARVYVLTKGETTTIIPRPGPDALMSLMRFSYVTRFGRVVLDTDAEREHLFRSSALARVVQVSTLVVPDSIERLDDAVRLIERDVS